MTTTLPNKTEASQNERTLMRVRYSTLRTWLFSWEAYIIVIVAGLLRLYMLNTTEFDDDQAAIYNMARNAVTHGYLVATSNVASVHIYNPPATIYFYMLAAVFSSNPMWGAVVNGLLMTISVLLTYIFVRRAYGRFTGTIAALLYATASLAVSYSRYMWNQNLLPIVVVLFMMTLFWGVVDRRKGWVAFAIPLIGLLVQLHATGILMAAPFAVALVLAPRTIRIRDILIGLLALLIIYTPYLVWEFSVKFSDVQILLNSMHHPSVIDDQAWKFYQTFLSPYPFNYNALPPNSPVTDFSHVYPYIFWLEPLMFTLAILGAIVALIVVLYPAGSWPTDRKWLSIPVVGRVMGYWTQFRNNPYRCGLLLLLVWQVVPLLYLSRHSLKIYIHYFIFFMPGQFILIAFLFGMLFKWLNRHGSWAIVPQIGRYLVAAVALVLILAQFAGTSANVLDYVHGRYRDGSSTNNLYNSLQAMQNAVNEADQLAQSHHLNHVYMSIDWPTQSAFRYLSTQMRTPVTLIESQPCLILADACTQYGNYSKFVYANIQPCLVLPNPADGPAVMLISPYNTLMADFLTHIANAKLVAESPRPGGAPFKLFIVNPSTQQALTGSSFGNDLQQLNASASAYSYAGQNYAVTRWSTMRSANAGYDTFYGYNMLASSSTKQTTSTLCTFSSMRTGDQMVVAFKQSGNTSLSANSILAVRAQSFNVNSYYLKTGPLTFETYRDIISPWTLLRTSQGGDSLILHVVA